MNNNYSAIPTGFSDLDRLLGGGLPRGALMILTSPFTAEGKTSFATTILRHAIHLPEIRSIIFTLEGTKETVTTKLLAMETGIDTMDMDRGKVTEEDLARLRAAHQNIERDKLLVVDSIVKSAVAIRESMVSPLGNEFFDLIVLDYLDLMGAWEAAEYAEVLHDLQLLARDSNAVILVVAHTIKNRLSQELMLRYAQALLVLDRGEESRNAHLEVWQAGKETHGLSLYFYPPTTRFFDSEEEFRRVYSRAK